MGKSEFGYAVVKLKQSVISNIWDIVSFSDEADIYFQRIYKWWVGTTWEFDILMDKFLW